MKLSELCKKQALIDVFDNDLVLEDGIAFLTAGFTSHKHAKTEAVRGGMYDSLFEAFERTWSVNQSIHSLKNDKDGIILEMGCADMTIYSTFKSMWAYPNYIGVDIRRDYLLRSIHRNRKDVVAMCADLMQPLPIKDGTISAIIICEVIEHLTYEQNMTAFAEAYRILKPGGKIFVSSPVNTMDREFHDLNKEKNLGHVFFWQAEQFEGDMFKLGFSAVDKKWGLSISSKININEIKKYLKPDVRNFLKDISNMYGPNVARAIALSSSDIVNGGCRFTVIK